MSRRAGTFEQQFACGHCRTGVALGRSVKHMSHFELDARRLICPMPVIRAQDRIAELDAGDTLEVVATDPGALHDIPAWCRVHGHEVVSAESVDDEVRVRVRVVR